MGGEIHGSLATIDIENHEQFVRTITQHLQSQVMLREPCDCDDCNRAEGNPYGNCGCPYQPCDSGW